MSGALRKQMLRQFMFSRVSHSPEASRIPWLESVGSEEYTGVRNQRMASVPYRRNEGPLFVSGWHCSKRHGQLGICRLCQLSGADSAVSSHRFQSAIDTAAD